MAKPNIDSQKPINEDTTMTIIKAAAVQLSPVLYSREGTVDKVAEIPCP
jgi:hypothetical protein